MLSYLHATGMHDTYDALKRDTDNDDFDPSDAKAKWVGLLEKKWTSVIRLQKKVHGISKHKVLADDTDNGPGVTKRITLI